MTDSIRPVRRALLSVSDKTGLLDLAGSLSQAGVELLSTGGTARTLRAAGLAVRDVADVTGFPEIMDGRVKTLHPAIHGGLLGVRGNAEHEAAMTEHGIDGIDLLVVNLYPFEETVARGAGFDDCIENIDIGGPAMIRAAAKNHASVGVVVDPADYADVVTSIRQAGGLDGALRRHLAGRAYARTAAYDAAIASWFAHAVEGRMFPDTLTLSAAKVAELRYGENPHQKAALYKAQGATAGIVGARQVQGKELSFNNLNDTDAALELISELAGGGPAVAIIKHANPCGVAVGETLEAAYGQALKCDPLSAFGGIIAANRPLDGATARAITQLFTEVVVAPDADDEALAVFATKKNLRLLLTGSLPDAARPGLALRSIAGGYLLQGRDNAVLRDADLKVVTRRQPTAQEMADMRMAFTVAKHVKSNAIVYVRDGATVGIGAGQMSRVDSARTAAWKAREAAQAAGETEALTKGSVVASDAFFPFADGLLTAIEAGATAVIQPGGGMRDDAVIAAADEAGIAMVMTGMRHFRH
jgi:phosphoribosylaminoimidazolecarboxamide formyltransferase/IMP cyclohydrolase